MRTIIGWSFQCAVFSRSATLVEVCRAFAMGKQILEKVVLVCAVMLLAIAAAFATSGIPAPFVISSPGAELLVRIDPGSGGEGRYLRTPNDSQNSSATYFRWDPKLATYVYYMTATLPQPVQPNVARINRTGYLVTIDNCVNRPWVATIGFLSPDGVLIKSYSLNDLYTPEMLDNMPFTETVIAGQCSGWLSEDSEVSLYAKKVFVTDVFGNTFDFDLSDGSYDYRQ